MVRATKNREPKVSANPANIPLPSTPITAIGQLDTPAAPKKPKAILEYLKPTVYKPDDNAAPTAPEEIFNALSRAGVRRKAPEKAAPEKVFPAPRKLFHTIVDGKTDAVIHKYVPTRLLMQISAHASQILEPKPWAGKYKIYGPYDTPTLREVLDAITLHHNIPVSPSSLPENLLTYEACLRLGIVSTHNAVKKLITTICTQLSSSRITPDVLNLVTERLGPKDAVFRHTAHVLCHQRFKGAVDDVQTFEKMVARKPSLQRAMAQIDRSHEARREAAKAAKQQWGKAGEGVEGGAQEGVEVRVEPVWGHARVRSIEEVLETTALVGRVGNKQIKSNQVP
ncbi:hypothetical protein EJ07DRAFT_176929 [Lizonia empirigonia]|nr:hypothetical protein EJ07DRAFT_176929 [Lizonia empirigonia]